MRGCFEDGLGFESGRDIRVWTQKLSTKALNIVGNFRGSYPLTKL